MHSDLLGLPEDVAISVGVPGSGPCRLPLVCHSIEMVQSRKLIVCLRTVSTIGPRRHEEDPASSTVGNSKRCMRDALGNP